MSLPCEVQLRNESGVYQPGQEVAGCVTLTLAERALLKFVEYKFSGYACTRWEKQRSAKDSKAKGRPSSTAEPATEHYEDREDYIATTSYLLGSESALPRIIDAGCYTFNFAVRLPNGCPPSFESPFGHIRYTIDVVVGHSAQIADELLLSRSIKVTPADLRLNSALLEPANLDYTESVRRTKFWQRPMQLHVNLPQTGYLPGDRISVYVKLLNDSHVTPTELVYKVNQVANYRGYNKKKKLKTKLIKTNLLSTTHSLRGEGDDTHVFEHLTSLQLSVNEPLMCQTTQCRCLQQTYEVEVSVHTSDHKRSVTACIPIVIGSLALQDRRGEEEPAEATETADKEKEVGAEASAQRSTPEEADNLSASLSSLTSFKEADFMPSHDLSKEFRHHLTASGDTDAAHFKPKYLYYNLDDPAPN